MLLLSKYDPAMAENLPKVKETPYVGSYLSPAVQNELINIISNEVSSAHGQVSGSETSHCYTFPGDSYLQFDFNSFNNSNDIHYSLKFQTSQPNALLIYSRGSGTHYDDEAVFIRNGKLVYHLFNTSPTGVEGYFGGYFQSNERVDINQWITLHVYRMLRVSHARQRRQHYKTGFAVEINGTRHEYVDHLVRSDISLSNSVFIGGYSSSLSSTIQGFRGQIKDIKEETNGLVFSTPTLNFLAKVQTSCTNDDPYIPPN